MNGQDVKEVMEQVHISSEMQEEIIMNIQNQLESGKKRTWDLRKLGTVAAAFILAAGVISVPVQAMVSSIVKARMESVPTEEMQGLNTMVQSQNNVQADGFSREYSDSEKERNKALWQAYKNGMFPEKVIVQVDNAGAAPEGTLCYIRATGVFNLPTSEMTDEEMLEIIDLQHKMSYAVSQETAAQEAGTEQAKAAQLEKIVQDAGGISKDEAVEIARKQLKTDIGDGANGLKLMTDSSGNGATLCDTAEEGYEGIDSKADVAYDVGFGNPDTHSSYGYIIDAVDGSILYTYKSN
ncbi:MAG: hypothetical protein NC400_09425 [Clostridium sp.]|nr:hypothetical protein [Clostridium sp.]